LALAPFFDRVFGAIGGHLAISREPLEEILRNVSVGIVCSDSTPNDTWISELTTNIIARLYPRIKIEGPDPLVAKLKALAGQINSSIEFVADAPEQTSISLAERDCKDAILPSAAGWVVNLTHEKRVPSGVDNPYSASAAAAFACAELFRRIFLQSPAERDFSLSLLDYGERLGEHQPLQNENIGDVAFVGVGAVGNAAIWALSRDNTRGGHLWLVDSETLTLLNLQRYVLATLNDISLPKVKIAYRATRATALEVIRCNTTLEQFAAKTKPLPATICISVDNVAGRRAAQALLPRLVVNGWTGERALGASWHYFSNGNACLACLYHPRSPGLSATEQAAKAFGLPPDRAAMLWVSRQPLSEEDLRTAAKSLGIDLMKLKPWAGKPLGELYTDVVCGAVPLSVKGLDRLEVVPLAHQSVLAGVLMIAELIKRTSPTLSVLSQPEPLVTWDDILLSPPKQWKRPRAKEVGCICSDEDFQAAYSQKWGIQSSSPV
jgi:hypothetical protein